MTVCVVFIGNFKHSFCSETYLARALEELGCEVVRWQQETASEHGGPLFGDFQLRAEDQYRNPARRPDLILYTRTHSPSALSASWTGTWQRLQAAGIKTASFHLDRFWDLEREHLIWDGDPLFTVQHCFTADGGNDDRFAAAGINHHWLPPAVDREEAEADVSHIQIREGVPPIIFVGSDYSQTNHRDFYPQRGELLRHLRSKYGHRLFGHYGHGGDRPVVRGLPLNAVYQAAKVVVGDSCFANRQYAPSDPHADHWLSHRYWSDRISETIGRGGYLTHPFIPGLDDVYGRGVVHTYQPGDWDELDWHINEAMNLDPDARRQISAARQAVILRAHTYTHRMRTLLDVCGLTERLDDAREESEEGTEGRDPVGTATDGSDALVRGSSGEEDRPVERADGSHA